MGRLDFLFDNTLDQSLGSDDYQDFQKRLQKNNAQDYDEQELIRKRLEAFRFVKSLNLEIESTGLIVDGECEDITNKRALPKLEDE